jgi:hypothetical protein
MLDRLEKDCVQHRSIRGVFAGYNLAPKRPDGDSAKPKETTLPFAIFGGYFQSQVKCTACSYESNTYDPYMDLSLEIKGASVDSALKHHTASEILEGDNKYLCPRFAFVCFLLMRTFSFSFWVRVYRMKNSRLSYFQLLC